MKLHLAREEILKKLHRAFALYPEDRGRPMHIQLESEDGSEVLKLKEDWLGEGIVDAVLAAYRSYPKDYVMVLVGEQIIEIWED